MEEEEGKEEEEEGQEEDEEEEEVRVQIVGQICGGKVVLAEFGSIQSRG